MDGRTALLSAIVAVQLLSAAYEVRSLLADGKTAGHIQTLLTNAVSMFSTLSTTVCGVRLRRVRRSLYGVERELRTPGDQMVAGADGRRTRAWLLAAVAGYGYLKYGQLMELADGGANVWTTAAVALLRSVSAAGNYYVTVIFVDHVFLAKRSVRVEYVKHSAFTDARFTRTFRLFP